MIFFVSIVIKAYYGYNSGLFDQKIEIYPKHTMHNYCYYFGVHPSEVVHNLTHVQR